MAAGEPDLHSTVSSLTAPSLKALRVLFVSALNPDYYGAFRLATLRRLRLESVTAVDQALFTGSGLLGKVQFRTQVGPAVRQFNREVLRVARQGRVNVAWFDKALGLWPRRCASCARWAFSPSIT